MTDPFLIPGPAAISFSGGRTSGFMLWRILQAYGGVLPADIAVCFANTGREMPATLDFVRDCGAAWRVRINWLEYRDHPLSGGAWVEQVNHNSAKRNGEPFEQLLRSKSMLPNPVARFCTIELKLRTQERFLRSVLQWDHWINIVGLRADEPKRVSRALARGAETKDRWRNACPLADAGVVEEDVFAFWRAQPFDLMTTGAWEGNCDGCFLKNRASLERMHKDHPQRMTWWERMEATPHGVGAGGTFRADREDYATMARVVRAQGCLPFDIDEPALPCDMASCGA